MRVVTTCNAAGWEKYGKRCFDGLKHWPENASVRWYTEGFDLPNGIRNETLTKLQSFKWAHTKYIPPDWRYNVARFANKVYAVHDALYDYTGIGVWMDADIIATKDIPEGYIESLLPADHYIALFQREGWHSECGLWVVDCSHPHHQGFLDNLLDWYEKGTFAQAHEWHDSVLMDATVRAFERDGLIKAHNLSGPHSKADHPMMLHPIAKYVDHLKGPTRKDLGYSPERKVA